MEDLEFHKELYYYELERRKELNEAVNVPIVVLTAIVSIHVFAYTQGVDGKDALFGAMLLFSYLTLTAVIISIIFLLISFSNFFKSYSYSTLAGGKEYLDHLNKKLSKNANEDFVRKEFQTKLIEAYAEGSSLNLQINKRRSEALANSKIGISMAVITTSIFSFFFITSLI